MKEGEGEREGRRGGSTCIRSPYSHDITIVTIIVMCISRHVDGRHPNSRVD